MASEAKEDGSDADVPALATDNLASEIPPAVLPIAPPSFDAAPDMLERGPVDALPEIANLRPPGRPEPLAAKGPTTATAGRDAALFAEDLYRPVLRDMGIRLVEDEGPSTFKPLKEDWQSDFERWQRRDLSARHYVYIRAEGVYSGPGRGMTRPACWGSSGPRPRAGRNSSASRWVCARAPERRGREPLVDLRARGLAAALEIAVGDGAMGFWKALDEIDPTTRDQRCWQHELVNVLNEGPKSVQPNCRPSCARSATGRIGPRRKEPS